MTIAEISKRFELSQDTLRYYERIGLLPAIQRNHYGVRNYNEEDCRWIEFIKCMRKAGLPIETLIEYVNLFHQGDETINARKDLLSEQRTLLMQKIEEMQETLQRLNTKITHYEECLGVVEQGLKK